VQTLLYQKDVNYLINSLFPFWDKYHKNFLLFEARIIEKNQGLYSKIIDYILKVIENEDKNPIVIEKIKTTGVSVSLLLSIYYKIFHLII
jgi:hypothetical protein